MNVQRIQAAIEMMKIAKGLDMCSWQDFTSSGNDSVSKSIEELHRCGNTACFAGYLAISEEFKAAGGRVCEESGSPMIGEHDTPTSTIAHYFELGSTEWDGVPCKVVQSIIYSEFTAPICFGFTKNGFSKDISSYPVKFEEVTPDMVIDKLEALLRGEYYGYEYIEDETDPYLAHIDKTRHTFKI